MARKILRNVCALAAPLALAHLAHAAVILSYEDYSASCAQATPCVQAAGVSGSNITSTWTGGAISSGYAPGQPWAAQFTPYGTLTGDFTMTASSSGTLVAFQANLFNNDCESGGNPVGNCTPMSWALSESVDGGAYSVIDSFTAGGPYSNIAIDVALNQSYNSGDTFAFHIVNTSGLGYTSQPGQYEFSDISLTGPDTPEPSNWLSLCGGLIAVAGLTIRRRVRA